MILLLISMPDLQFIHRYIQLHTYQILFRSANSFESFCVDMKSPRSYRQTDRQTDSQTGRQADKRKFFFCLFCLLRHTKHEHSSTGENFFFTYAITILSLFTYSVCDEKVINKIKDKNLKLKKNLKSPLG